MTEPGQNTNDILIELQGLQRYYRGRKVLDIDQLILMRGHRYALVGANGSGKSTLLKLLAGAIKPSGGEIVFHGLDGDYDRAYLPQKPYIFSCSALKNVMMAIPDKNADKQRRRLQAEQAMRLLGIAELADGKANRFSGGEGQRLALARILVVPHQLLLLDEPTSATDIAGNELFEEALNNYLQQTQATLIFATHALSQAVRLADTVIFLDGGKAVEQGPPEQVLYHPQSAGGKAFLRFWQG